MIMAASERNVPLILINGRLSERSFNRWRMIPRTIGALLRRFDLCLAQSTDDGARYAGLGAPRISTTGNLKLDVPAPAADADKLAALQDVLGTRPVIAAASTHPGEETEIDRRAPPAQAQLSGIADHHRAAASRARARASPKSPRSRA